MMDYDSWTTNPDPSDFVRSMKLRGIRKGTFDYEEALKNEFADYIASEADNGSDAIEFVIQKFFGGWEAFKKAIVCEVSRRDEAFREFARELES